MGGGVSSLPAEVTLAEAKELAGTEWQPAWEEKFADAEAKISRDDAVRCWTEAKANDSPSADGPESRGAGPLDERKDAGARWKKGVAKVGWIAHAKAAALPLGVSDSDAVARLSPLQNAPVIRLESALGLLCGVDDAAARRELNAEAARLLNVPAWGAKCFQPCKSELKEWLSDDEIARGAQGANFFSLRVPKPPPLDTCVRKS